MTNRLRAGLADLAIEATPVDLLDRVHRGARRVARRNRAFGALAGILLAICSVTGYLTLSPGVGPEPQPADLSNATFSVPAYPGPWASPCPEGEYTFANGIADTGAGSKLVIADTQPLQGDLDAAPGDETVIMLRCDTEGQSDNNPLAVRAEADGTITTLGWVNVDADGELLVRDPAEPVEIVDGSVRVTVLYRYDAPERRDKQTRAYQYRDGRMTQLAGPTAFPAPATDATTIDLYNTTLYVSTNDDVTNGFPDTYTGFVKLNNGSSSGHLEKLVDGTNTGSVRATVTVEQTAYVPTNSRLVPVVVLQVTPDDAPQRSVVMAYHHDELTGWAFGVSWTVFTTEPGAAVPTMVVSDGRIVVTAGEVAHTFLFNPGANGGFPWFEV